MKGDFFSKNSLWTGHISDTNRELIFDENSPVYMMNFALDLTVRLAEGYTKNQMRHWLIKSQLPMIIFASV